MNSGLCQKEGINFYRLSNKNIKTFNVHAYVAIYLKHSLAYTDTDSLKNVC